MRVEIITACKSRKRFDYTLRPIAAGNLGNRN
jgi:hypothetical protein